ncbi:uncharacterized protein BO96DRAFT_428522 [Aspergillus niger CBS 101883]|uniref:Uncharacterized protein n=3 Tax=Aspergillus niger TaxID=5061 RepID=A2QSV0_ASPNC|nr:uncharacterized protein BO96DRAFT_428522 [Aspergillus niger CBS 101883]XP_059601264.1 hypothetical protein An08g12020 [Aspergillus niger]PYH61751.1 hypothetical protein BO96DRAFT_428522 [Aspergillus niger CBS 101883]RDH14188.1 hypothetical protein M747DRAFT_319735 [Aspergillus niger ATCC 13496]CAK40078.1 hypothetical protein An08g12020 [Aspergillus niger]
MSTLVDIDHPSVYAPPVQPCRPQSDAINTALRTVLFVGGATVDDPSSWFYVPDLTLSILTHAARNTLGARNTLLYAHNEPLEQHDPPPLSKVSLPPPTCLRLQINANDTMRCRNLLADLHIFTAIGCILTDDIKALF